MHGNGTQALPINNDLGQNLLQLSMQYVSRAAHEVALSDGTARECGEQWCVYVIRSVWQSNYDRALVVVVVQSLAYKGCMGQPYICGWYCEIYTW